MNIGLLPLLFSNPLLFVLTIGILTLALTIHEFAHAWVADKLGDPTPRVQGRVTLDPRAHLDPVGTAMLIFIGFGWGKPVEFDPYNLKNPARDVGLIAFAGPLSNIALSLIITVCLSTLSKFFPDLSKFFADLLYLAVYYNVMLAIFNLVPVHPLDGGKVLSALLPHKLSIEYDHFFFHYGQWILLGLLIPWSGVSPIAALISPPIQAITQLFMQLSITILRFG